MPWPAVAAGVALAGGIYQNRQNQQEAKKARAFNAAEAQKNRDFQRTMSNTAYQRSVLDMKAAGINPMLAYQKGGASTPGGSSASGPAARMEDVAAGAVNSAMAAKRLKADLAISEQTARKTKAEADREESINYALGTSEDPDGVLRTTAGPGLWPHLWDRTRYETQLKANQLPYSRAQAQFFGGLGQYAPYAAMGIPMLGAMGRIGGPLARGGAAVARKGFTRARSWIKGRRSIQGIGRRGGAADTSRKPR